MAFASVIHDLFPAFSTGRILKFRMGSIETATKQRDRWREERRHHSPRRLLVNYSTSSAVVGTVSRSIRPKKRRSLGRRKIQRFGPMERRCFGKF